MSPGL